MFKGGNSTFQVDFLGIEKDRKGAFPDVNVNIFTNLHRAAKNAISLNIYGAYQVKW